MPPAKPEPGRDPGMAALTEKLNVLFALSSVGLLLILALMVWADYDRDWKSYQIEFNKLEVQHTEEEIQTALGKVDAQRRQEIEAGLAQGQQEIAAKTQEVANLKAKLRALDGEWYAADQDFRFTKAHIDVARYQYNDAVHKAKSNVADYKAKLDRLEQLWSDQRLARETTEAQQAEQQAELEELERTYRTAEKEQGELFAQKTLLESKLAGISPGFVSFTRNLPLLDMANPSLRVRQIMPANLYDDVILTRTPKVDRCTTCHLGIAKAGYEDAPQPFTTHPNMALYLKGPHPIEKVGCTICHQGRGRATRFQKAAHSPSTKNQEEEWGRYMGTHKYEPMHHWDLPMLTQGHTESQCIKCHRDQLEVPKAKRLNTGRRLIERYGCYGCHKIKGWEKLRKVGPDLSRVASKTNEEWMFRWVKNPRAFRWTRMPQIWDVRLDESAALKDRNNVEANAAVAYIMAKSARTAYPAPPPGDPDAGRATFESVGCLGCHRIGDDMRGIETLKVSTSEGAREERPMPSAAFRTHGPNLAGSGSKLDAGWLYAWVRDPKSYWHETRMPSLRLSRGEAADVTAYLMTLKNEEFLAQPRPALDTQLRDDVVREYLRNRFTVAQADEKLAAMGDEERTLFLGERTIGRFGCFGCHSIPGFENTNAIGTELTAEGSKLVDRLDFGFEHERLPHTLPAWLNQKLMEPRIFDRDKDKNPWDLLRMPHFHFEPEEADAIVTAILSLTKEQVPLVAQRPARPGDDDVFAGARLVRDLNCQGCHQIGELGGSIQDVVRSHLKRAGGDEFQASALSPPLLYNADSKVGEGSRVRTQWLHDFLKDPSNTIRPWLDIRMPTFDFSEDEINVLTRYFAALDQAPFPYSTDPKVNGRMVAQGRDLFQRWQCVKCHVVAGKLPNQEKANMAPDLALVPERLRADWLSLWLADPGRVQPGTRMPTNFPVDPAENAFPEILGGDQAKQIEAVRAYLLSLGS